MEMRGILGHILYVVIIFKLISVFSHEQCFFLFLFLFHNEIAVSMFGFNITRGEMKSLIGKQWVNSLVM